MNQVARNEGLLDTARDYFYFVTKFFEPINVSATHIYHSALELSPLSSIVRRLYSHQWKIPSPRVIAGTPNSWDHSINISGGRRFHCCSYTWSPCGRFVATGGSGGVEIRDPLSSELLSTLTKSGAGNGGEVAYSPDGLSLACCSDDTLVIWDIQTGGVAKEIEFDKANAVWVTWSLSGEVVGVTGQWWCPDKSIHNDTTYAVHIFNISSGIRLAHVMVQSIYTPYLWDHNTSFQVMTVQWDGQGCTIDISEIGTVLSKIESFHIGFWGECPGIGTFSPTTYQISISVDIQLCVLDIQNSECLLQQDGHFDSHCFSPNGSLFAASVQNSIHIWKYDSGHYIPWREFSTGDHFAAPLHFSPNSQSILGYPNFNLCVQQLNGPPIFSLPSHHVPLAVLSQCGTYMVTGYHGGSTVHIASLVSPNPSQFIETGMEIEVLALTGNILLVVGFGMVKAWQLTNEGVVDHNSSTSSNSIWTVSVYDHPTFSIEDQTVTIKWTGVVTHIYHSQTGEVLEPTQTPHPNNHQYSPKDIYHGQHYPHYHKLEPHSTPVGGWPVSYATLQEGWVKDPKGSYKLWVPPEWRLSLASAGWLCNITTLWLNLEDSVVIIIF